MLERIGQRKAWAVSALIGAILAGGGMTVSDYVLQNPDQVELLTIEGITDAIIDSQEAFFEIHGRYWQGLKTDLRYPQDGVALTPARLDIKPSDEPKSWAELVTFPEKLFYQLEVVSYGSRDEGNAGYQILFRKQEGGLVLERSIGFGYAEYKTYNWKVIEEIITPIASSTPL